MQQIFARSGVALFALGLSLSALAGGAQAPRTLTVTTMNIRYFGLGGSLSGEPKDEKRDGYIRSFLTGGSVPRSDIYAFQEIVDVERLQRVLPQNYSCKTYDNNSAKHQHVVLCAAPNLRLDSEPTDNNDIIDEVAINPEKSRPALHFRIKDAQGNLLGRVVAVHLKAYPEESETRQRQSEAMGRYLSKLKSSGLPTIILGDFNTYPAPSNKQTQNDDVLIDSIFKDFELGLKQVVVPAENTFRSPRSRGHFDRIWMSSELQLEKAPSVFPVCNTPDGQSGQGFLDPDYYYKNVSDHCPVTVSIRY